MAVCCEGVEAGAAVTVRSERVEEEGHRDVSEACEVCSWQRRLQEEVEDV